MTAPIALQLYSLRDAAADGLEPVLRRVAGFGYAGVELAGFGDLGPTRLREVLDDTGLTLASAHLGDPSPGALAPVLDDLASIGCETVVLAFLPPASFADAGAIARSAAAVNTASRLASERGMRLGYHNHWWEFETKLDGRCAWDCLFDQVEPDVFAELDVYWAAVGGADPRVIASHERVQLLHVKDGPADQPSSSMVAVGSGRIPIRDVLNSAPQARWHVVELDRCDTDMFDAVEASYRWLTGNGLSRGRA